MFGSYFEKRKIILISLKTGVPKEYESIAKASQFLGSLPRVVKTTRKKLPVCVKRDTKEKFQVIDAELYYKQLTAQK